MDELGPIIAAGVAIVAAVVPVWYSTRRLTRLGYDKEQLQINAGRVELVQIADARALAWKEKYEGEVAAREAERQLAISDKALLVEKLRDTQHDLDDCARQRDDAWSKLRARVTQPPRRRA